MVKIKFNLRKIVISFFLILSACIFFERNSFSQKIIKNVPYGTYYANLDEIQCDEKTIVITSSCVSNDELNSNPYCFSQSVSFVKNKSENKNILTYSYDEDKQNFIYQATCLKYKNKFYLRLISSNLGNCKICEWNDYFDADGTYLASSNGISNKTSFKKNSIKKYVKIFKNAREIQNIDLTTVNK